MLLQHVLTPLTPASGSRRQRHGKVCDLRQGIHGRRDVPVRGKGLVALPKLTCLCSVRTKLRNAVVLESRTGPIGECGKKADAGRGP